MVLRLTLIRKKNYVQNLGALFISTNSWLKNKTDNTIYCHLITALSITDIMTKDR
jgi:hypothetical protein